MTILIVYPLIHPTQHKPFLYGLGDDNKMYLWSPKAGDWIPYVAIKHEFNPLYLNGKDSNG